MKILHVYKDYFPVLGGIENHVRVLAEQQVRSGLEAQVLACSPGWPGRRTVLDGVPIVWAGRLTTLQSMPISPTVPLLARRLAPDIVHVHSPFPLGELSALLLPRRTPVVVTHHSDVVRQRAMMRVYAPLYRRFVARVDRIIVTSRAYAETSPWLGGRRDAWRVVPLGIDPAVFTPDGPRIDDAAELLFVGRLRYYKGLDTLFAALHELPGVRLDIVGEGRMAAEWRASVAAQGLAGRVRFLGDLHESELPARYRSARLFVLPANCRAEAFGTVLIEAMWPKSRIMEMYANVIEYGDGVYGAQAASRRFFGKDASALTPAEAARLAAVLPNPRKYSVAKPGAYVQRRSAAIQRQMRALGGPGYLAFD